METLKKILLKGRANMTSTEVFESSEEESKEAQNHLAPMDNTEA